MILGAWLTSLLCLLLPPFSVAAVFIMPLFLCPLAGSKKEVWAYPVGLAAILLGASLWTRQVFFPVWLLLAIARRGNLSRPLQSCGQSAMMIAASCRLTMGLFAKE